MSGIPSMYAVDNCETLEADYCTTSESAPSNLTQYVNEQEVHVVNQWIRLDQVPVFGTVVSV